MSNTALNTSENILMCAPTGAGKTNVAMLAILHTMSLYRNAETGKIDTSKFKIVYVAPMKVPKHSHCTIGCDTTQDSAVRTQTSERMNFLGCRTDILIELCGIVFKHSVSANVAGAGRRDGRQLWQAAQAV